MSELVVIGFDDEQKAFELRAELAKMQKEQEVFSNAGEYTVTETYTDVSEALFGEMKKNWGWMLAGGIIKLILGFIGHGNKNLKV